MKLNSRWFGCALILFGFSLATIDSRAAPFPSPADWRNENIYQIFTDRFYDGDPSNDNVESGRGSPYDPTSPTGIHGGDFRGIQQKLDYIKSLGATAIWISPIPLNAGGNSAYHGYAAQDFYTLAPHWGTMADLSNMVAAAHARGMKVILDIVVNHSADLLSSSDSNYPTFTPPPGGYVLQYTNPSQQHAPPFNITNAIPPAFPSIFHTNGVIQSFSTTQEVVLGELDGLDDFATETTYVRTNMMNIYTNWVGLADFDGFRVDTTKHVDYGFWQYWCPQLHQFATSIGKSNFFMFGEVFNTSLSDDPFVGSYTGTEGGGAFKEDSVLDYVLYGTINSVFATASGNTAQIATHYNQIAPNYDTNAWYRLVTFLDNHDNPRFLNVAGDNTNRLNVALEFLYTSRGVPCLYYGTEQAFDGPTDPNNREDMFAGQFEQGPSVGDNFDETHPLFELVAKLNNFRRLYPALRTGAHNNLWSNSSGPGLFAYSRVLSNQEVIVCFNTAASSQTLTNLPTSYAPGTVLINLLNTNDTMVVLAGATTNTTPQISVPSTTAKIYLAQSQVLPLDPVVVSQSPAHAAGCIGTSAPILLQFSKPMDTNSVQAAFSVTPTTTGTFTWSALHDTMTFTPSIGWHTFTTNFVHLATNAFDSVSSNSLFAAFDTYFVTFTTNSVTASSSPVNGGATTGSGTVNCGSNVTVCVAPTACYRFAYWTRGGHVASTSPCYTFSATGNEVVVANFLNGQGSIATDNAFDPAYSGSSSFSWTNTVNGGIGFNPWIITTTSAFPPSGCNGFFVSSSTKSSPHTSPGIDVGGESWGIYANGVNCGAPEIATAYRTFAIGSVQVGGQLLIDMDNGLNDTAGSAVGFALRNGNATNTPADYATGARFQFYLAGGNSDYTIVDAAGAYDSGVPLTYSGMHLSFILGTNDSYTLTLISYGTGLTNVIQGTLGGTANSTLDSIALFNNDNGTGSPHDIFFNSLSVLNLSPITCAINTSSSPANGGTTSGSGSYNCSANVTVTATPNTNYNFVSWTEGGTVVSTSPSYTFIATTNRILVADFISETPFQVWQLQYFGCTNCAQASATADPDSDGYNNLQEFLSGTNPTDPSSHPTNFPPNLVAWWKLDEPSGSTAVDSSDNNNAGNVTLGDGDWTSGMVNGALFFDGESTQISVSNSPSLNVTNGITLAAWVNAGAWFTNTRILEKGKSDNQYGLFVNGSGQLEFLLSGVTNGTLLASPPSANSWHHLVATYGGTLMSLYIDGQQVAQQPGSGPIAITADPLSIGEKPTSGPLFAFYGALDDVRIYSVALSSTQIVQLYNTDSVGDGIANWWRQQYFGSSSSTGATTCATCDFDNTGQNNRFKYVAGLDPTDLTSVFFLRIASVSNQAAQESLLFNPLALGRTYTPQFSTDLVGGIWTPLSLYSGPFTNGNQITITDPTATLPRKFYRIDISVP